MIWRRFESSAELFDYFRPRFTGLIPGLSSEFPIEGSGAFQSACAARSTRVGNVWAKIGANCALLGQPVDLDQVFDRLEFGIVS